MTLCMDMRHGHKDSPREQPNGNRCVGSRPSLPGFAPFGRSAHFNGTKQKQSLEGSYKAQRHRFPQNIRKIANVCFIFTKQTRLLGMFRIHGRETGRRFRAQGVDTTQSKPPFVHGHCPAHPFHNRNVHSTHHNAMSESEDGTLKGVITTRGGLQQQHHNRQRVHISVYNRA